MSEHSEHPAEGAPASSAPATPPTAEGDVIGTAPSVSAGERPPSRFRRWSANASVRMGAVAIVAGLIGGLVGGGIVAAFSGDGHDVGVKPMGFERGMPGGPPGFRGPRYWMPRGGPGWQYPPNVPPAPPVPTPTTTG